MQHLKSLLMVFMILVNCSCTTSYRIPDIEFCGKLDVGAVCSTTLTHKRRPMGDSEWFKKGRVSMTHQDFGEIIKAMVTACKLLPGCE